MKFVIALMALVAMASANPGKWGGSESGGNFFFENTLDNIQGALEDVAKAGEDLSAKEDQLDELVKDSMKIMNAETLLEAAVEKTAYSNSYAATADE